MIKRCYPNTDNKYRENVADYWDKVFSEVPYEEYVGTLEYEEPAALVREFAMGLDRNSKILDLGCGGGRFLHMLSSLGFNDLTGADISKAGLAMAQEHIPGLKTYCGSVTSLPFEGEVFDFILMVGVVYEIEDAVLHFDVFSEAARVLKPGGTFIFINKSPHNVGEKLYSITERLRGKNHVSGRFFVWRIDRADVARWSESTDFHVIDRKPSNFGLGLFRFLYSVCVKKSVVQDRINTIKSLNTYSTSNHHYLANRRKDYFNWIGRFIFSHRSLFIPLFHNAEIYRLEKTGERATK